MRVRWYVAARVGVPKRWLGDDESRKAEWRWCSDDSVSAQTAAIALSDHVGAASSTTSSIPTPTAIHPTSTSTLHPTCLRRGQPVLRSCRPDTMTPQSH